MNSLSLSIWSFRKAGSPPAISSIDIDLGDVAGGELRTLTGTLFTGATSVDVEDGLGVSHSATFLVTGPTEILVVMPSGSAGTGAITVTSPTGTSAPLAYEYWGLAQLSLTGCWDKGNYQDVTAGTWPGLASAGSSAGRDLTQSTAAKQPAELNLEPDFDGSNDVLTGTSTGTLFSLAAYSVNFLARFDSALAPTGLSYDDAAIVGDTGNGQIYINFTTSGLFAGHFNGAAHGGITPVAAPVGKLILCQVSYNGTTLRARVDGGAWSSVARGNIAALPGNLSVGEAFSAYRHVDGSLRTLTTSNAALADADADKFLKWAKASRGLA